MADHAWATFLSGQATVWATKESFESLESFKPLIQEVTKTDKFTKSVNTVPRELQENQQVALSKRRIICSWTVYSQGPTLGSSF